MLVTPEGQLPEIAGHLYPVEPRTSQTYSSTVGTGVEIPGMSGDDRGAGPGKGRYITTGGATFKELTPIATRPGRPYGGTASSADCGTGRWSLKRDQMDHSHLQLRSFFPPLGTSDGSARNKAVLELKMILVQSGSIPADLGGSKKGACGMQLQEMAKVYGRLCCSAASPREARVR